MKRSRKFLLDTHIFIWFMEKNPRLDRKLLQLITNPYIQVFISVASIWEIIIKRQKTTLKVPKNILEGIQKMQFQILPIEASHVMQLERLPNYHKDPFDRILIAQAKEENLTLVTSDEKIKRYLLKP